jgi:Leucine-rich repeat (LRR) protein
LEGFTSLEELDFSFNEITDLELSQCPNLRNIFSNDNLLTNLNFLNSLDSEKLEEITVDSNNLQTTNLTPFSRFVNLKEL